MDGPELRIPLSPSRLLLLALLLLHGAALVAPWCANLPDWLRAVLALLVLFSLLRAWPAAWWRGELALETRAGVWSLRRDGESQAVALLPDSTVWSWIVVLRLRCADGVRSLVLLPDSAMHADIRRLRTRLRLCEGRSGRQDGVEGLR